MRSPIRIRFLYTRYPHWCSRSGFTQIAHHLDAAQFRPVMDGASDSDDDVPRWLARAKPRLRRRIEAGAMPWYKLSDLMAELRAVPGAVGGRYHLVHFLDGEHGGMYLPGWLRRLPWPRPCTVASFHQPPELQSRLLNPDIVRCFDHVTVLSPSQLPFFRALLPPERIHLLPHGVDTEFFHPPAARPMDDRIRCITVGHWLRDWRVIKEVASALVSDPRVSFHVVTARETGLESLPNVVHHRGIPDQALAELYRTADILLLPLQECTANNALLEGIASGLPVISTDLDGARFHLSMRESMLVPVGDAQACLAAVRALQCDPERRREMGRQARLHAEELAWPKIAGRFAELYRSFVHGSPASGNTRTLQEPLHHEKQR